MASTPSHTSSPSALDDHQSHSSSEEAHSPPPPKRQRSVSFHPDTKNMPSRQLRQNQPSSDEVGLIRDADGAIADPVLNNDSTRRDVAQAESSDGEKTPWYRSLADKYGSVSLENKGSVARDHLALERTFLAWLRTSLAFASIGIAITQLFRLNTSIARASERRRAAFMARREKGGGDLPFSPMVGHSLDIGFIQEVLGYPSGEDGPEPANLLDQLLSITPNAFDEDAAARLRHVGKPLGATFLAISIVVLFVGFHRYFEAQHWIIRGKFPASRGSVALVGFIAGALIVASLVVVLVVAPSSFEKK